jgi:hypothetical protein
MTPRTGRVRIRALENEPRVPKPIRVSIEPATETDRAMPLSISFRTHLWPTWAEVAIDEESEARTTRSEMKNAVQGSLKQGLGDLLLGELRASMVSIAAVSHALEALAAVLAELVIPSNVLQKWRDPGKRNPPARTQVLETIKGAVAGDGNTLSRWAGELEWLFDLRNSALHYTEETGPAVLHPSGTTNASGIYQDYCVENAARSVDLLLEVLTNASSSPRRSNVEVMKWAEDYRRIIDQLRERRGNS